MTFLMDLLFDAELERLLHEDPVQIVQVGAVLGGAETAFELVVGEVEGPAAVKQQGVAFDLWHQFSDLAEEPFGEQEPVEGFGTDQVAVVAAQDGLLGEAPAADGVEQGFEPVGAGEYLLAHSQQSFVRRGQRGWLVPDDIVEEWGLGLLAVRGHTLRMVSDSAPGSRQRPDCPRRHGNR